MNKKLIFEILIAIVVIVGIFFIYRYFKAPEPAVNEGFGLQPAGFLNEGRGQDPDDEFLTLLLSLQSISLESDVYPVLRSLTDFSTELVPQTPGRENPFAPIGRGSRPATSTRTTGAPAGTNAAGAGNAGSGSGSLFDFLNN